MSLVTLLIIIVLILALGGGGTWRAYNTYGPGYGIGGVILIVVILYLLLRGRL